MASGNKANEERVDPAWPQGQDGEHAVSEFLADKQGALSPFGDTSFPITEDTLGYQHPVTRINWS